MNYSPRQQFINSRVSGSTPMIAPARPIAPVAPAPTTPAPVNRPAAMNTQVRTAQEALARNKAVQKTYGVPGAK